MSNLNIISPNSRLDGIYINGVGNLSYYGKGQIVSLSNWGSIDRPLYLSDLIDKLDDRGWHIQGRKVIKSGDILAEIKEITEDQFNEATRLPVYNTSDDTINIVDGAVDSSDLDTLTEIYNKIMKEKESIILYSSSKMVFDFANGQIIVNDLVKADEYTNTLSLENIAGKVVQKDLSAKVDLTVQYSIDGNVTGQDITFEAFRYDQVDGKIVMSRDNFISSISNAEVLVEYVDGVIRVIPESNDVDECIISNCVLTYGKL